MGISGIAIFEFADDRPSERVPVSFSADEANLLGAFLVEAAALNQKVIEWGGIPASIHFKGEKGGPVKFEVTEPSDDQRAVLLHRLRPFLLEREPFSFKRTRSLVGRGSSHPFLGERLRQLKILYSCERLRQQFRIERKDFLFNSEHALNRWLNAAEYHRDPSAAAELCEAQGALPTEVARAIFVGMLATKTTAVFHLGNVIHTILNKRVVSDTPDA
jgi:hypothetical protein